MNDNDLLIHASKMQKIIRWIIGIIGGTITALTLMAGIYAMVGLSLTMLGLLVVVGMVPLEMLLTYCAIKDTKVYLCDDLSEEQNLEEESQCQLTLIKSDNKSLEQTKEIDNDNGIKPMVHLELLDSSHYTRKREKNKR